MYVFPVTSCSRRKICANPDNELSGPPDLKQPLLKNFKI
jgi:hypothetical protein